MLQHVSNHDLGSLRGKWMYKIYYDAPMPSSYVNNILWIWIIANAFSYEFRIVATPQQ